MRVPRFTAALAVLMLAACSNKDTADTKSDVALDTTVHADPRATTDTMAVRQAAVGSMRVIPDSMRSMPPKRHTQTGAASAEPQRAATSPKTSSTPGDSTKLHPSKPHPTPIPVSPPDLRPPADEPSLRTR